MDAEVIGRELVRRAVISARVHGCDCDPHVVVRRITPTPVVDTAHRPLCRLVLRSRARWN